MSFNIQELQNKLGPITGIVSVIIGLIVAVASGFGANGSSNEADDNVVFQVVDQSGRPQYCAVRINTTEPQTDIARWTDMLGRYSVSAEPGTEISLVFDCDRTNPGDHTAIGTVVAPETGTVTEKVVVNMPEEASGSSR